MENHMFNLINILLIFLISSCATNFLNTREFKEADEKCKLSSNYWGRNDQKLCELLSKKISSTYLSNLYIALAAGTNCEKKLEIMITAAKDKSVSDEDFEALRIPAMQACFNFVAYNVDGKKFYSKDYHEIALGATKSTRLFCKMAHSSILESLKMNLSSESNPDICYKHINLLISLADNEYSTASQSDNFFREAQNAASTLCNLKYEESCSLKNKVHTYIKELKKRDAEVAARKRLELEKEKVAEDKKRQIQVEEAKRQEQLEKERIANQQAYDTEVRHCKAGNKQICWGLYVANKDNQYGYEHLRDACLFGHKQACLTKKVLDDEKQANITRDQQQAIIEQQQMQYRRQEIENARLEKEDEMKMVYCLNKNKDMTGIFGGWICDEKCPGYQHCINMQALHEQKKIQRNRKVTCRTNGYGGILNTECTEDAGYLQWR